MQHGLVRSRTEPAKGGMTDISGYALQASLAAMGLSVRSGHKGSA